MPNMENLFTNRKSLDEICVVPDQIISVYSLEKHVWADSNSNMARQSRQPELKTIEEFQIAPVRPFLTDLFRHMAAPYKPENKANPIGQGYWIQAEFGSGKSHLLCFLASLSLGNQSAWNLLQQKEQKAGRGKRDSLYLFWEEGLEAKSKKGKGIFVVVKTLVGTGGGAVGLADKGRRLTDYILDAVKEQIQTELGKNISLYPAELLANRLLSKDLDRYRADLRKFLRDPKYWDEDEFIEIDDFIRDIQEDKSPEYKRSCGDKLWRFYDEYLESTPHIPAEIEDILKHMVEVILAEGYSGVLLVLDEVSLFMKNRTDKQRTDDENTLVVLSNRLAKIHNLPIWTVCAAQQAIESKMGVKNILADDRLKLVKLLEEDNDYYDIVLARVREIKDNQAYRNYYLYYQQGFTWPKAIGEQEFSRFFPFHKPALQVLRSITYELTTARSAIHFMHQTLKHQIKVKGKELIRLWELFDEAVRYEEDPSGVHAGLVAIKTKRESEYRSYESCRNQLNSLTHRMLNTHRDKAIKIIQTLFLYYIARVRQQDGLSAEELANDVLIERDADSNAEENIEHYETLADNLRKQLRQIVQSFGEDSLAHYRFDPIVTGIDPRLEFQKAREEMETNEVMQREALEHLLDFDEWSVKTRNMKYELSHGHRSIFHDLSQKESNLEVVWQGRQIAGFVKMADLGRVASDDIGLRSIATDETDLDFGVFISSKPVAGDVINKLLKRYADPRIIYWTPDELKSEERDRLIDFAAYRKLIADWQGKDTEDALTVINWVYTALESDLGKISNILPNSYARGRMDAQNNSQMEFHVAGELVNILNPIVDRVLTSEYESRNIKFEPPVIFRKEEGVKVINGIVKTGFIPKDSKPNQNISAAQNFGFGLQIIKKSAEKELDVSGNPYITDMWSFIDQKLVDEGQPMKVDTLYKNFMGIGGPKNYGLTRRMVQIYLLCLSQRGKVRIHIGPKSGLQIQTIDYANIAGIDFSVKVLDSFTAIQKLAKPENWEVLRPYAEKLLQENIRSTHDDAIISQYRSQLRDMWGREKEESEHILTRATNLFEILKASNPYEKEIQQFVKLFAQKIESGNDIDLMLYALQQVFQYKAFEANAADPVEVDDLANRLRNYHDMRKFLNHEQDLRLAQAYCSHPLPDMPDLKEVRKNQQKVRTKLLALQTYIDSEVKLKTELIGKIPPLEGETGTCGVLWHQYRTVYLSLHQWVVDQTDTHLQKIRDIFAGDDLRAFKILEKIKVLQPATSPELEKELKQIAENIFTCSTPSVTSIEEGLKLGPVHICGLTFTNAPTYINEAQLSSAKAESLFEATFNRKMDIFFNPAVRTRLEQGLSEPMIAKLVSCQNVAELRKYLTSACLQDPAIIEIINRYLKRIEIKRINLADFKPSLGTIEKDQIPHLAEEFQKFLENQIQSIPTDEDTLPMLQLES